MYTERALQHLLAGRGRYSEYVMNNVGQTHYSLEKFRQGINTCHQACKEVLDDEVEALHGHLKSLGIWKKGYCGADGSWSKPAPAPHGLFCCRCLHGDAKGGILGYTLFSTKDLEFPYMGTSDSMEVMGALIVMSKLCALGYSSEELKIVCDGDTNIGKVTHIRMHMYTYIIFRHSNIFSHYSCVTIGPLSATCVLLVQVCSMLFENVMNLCCSNHINKNLGKCVGRVGPSRPKGCLCEKRRGHQWKKPCGCCNASFMIKHMKAANMKIMIKVHTHAHVVLPPPPLPNAITLHPLNRPVNERRPNGTGVGLVVYKIAFFTTITMIALITTRFQATKLHLTCE